MSAKRALQRRKAKQKQPFIPPRPIGLLPGEVGIIPDFENPGRIHSYMLHDGTHIKLNNDSVPAKVPLLEPSLMVTSMSNKGERNTLAYRFGEMMTIAQRLFGPRDMSYSFLGFEFIPDHGRVRFVTEKSLVIQLGFRAMVDPVEAYFELAHECIHLLSPHPYEHITILEEGMASVFSLIYMRDTIKIPVLPSEQKAYQEAATLVAMLMEIDPYGIKKMREEEPAIWNINKWLILKHYPMIPEGVAARLARTFLNGEIDSPAAIAQYQAESIG
jgi:hypothetical protein